MTIKLAKEDRTYLGIGGYAKADTKEFIRCTWQDVYVALGCDPFMDDLSVNQLNRSVRILREYLHNYRVICQVNGINLPANVENEPGQFNLQPESCDTEKLINMMQGLQLSVQSMHLACKDILA